MGIRRKKRITPSTDLGTMTIIPKIAELPSANNTEIVLPHDMELGGVIHRLSCKDRYFYWHSQSLVATELKEPICPTLAAAMGMGGAVTTSPILILSGKRHTQETVQKGKDGK